MKYLKRFSITENSKIDDILDKIHKNGEKSLTQLEHDYLIAYSKDNYDEMQKIEKDENIKHFISNNGNFKFELEKIEPYNNSILYYGTMIVPSLHIKNTIINGQFYGYIEDRNNIILINFIKKYNGKLYNIEEFCKGTIEELFFFIETILDSLES